MSKSAENTTIQSLFFPYYINQSRLLDLFAILNQGLVDYEEVNSSSTNETKKSGSTKVDANAGFRIFKIGASAEGVLEGAAGAATGSTIRKIQTPTSMLDLVISQLQGKGYIHDILNSDIGSFVLVPVRLKINSIKGLLKEAEDLVELGGKMQALGSKSVPSETKENLKQIKEISKVVKELFGAEEIVSESEEYALVGSIVDDCLYQSVRADIVDTPLTCLAQVRNIFPNGTQLMKNTVFTKIVDEEIKSVLAEALKELSANGDFIFESDAIVSIVDKPVYQLEVVALYQTAEATIQC